MGLESVADTGGRFEITVRRPPGCYLFSVRMIGYGGTDRTVPLGGASVVEVGDIFLREAPIPEWRLLFLEECVLPDSVTVGGPPRRSFEDHVLEKVRDAAHLRRLVPCPGPHEEPQRHRPGRRAGFGDDLQAVIENMGAEGQGYLLLEITGKQQPNQ